MTPVELPKANENLTEATLSHWLVKEGQWVVQTQSLCVIITDKATFEMPSPVDGLVRRIYQQEKALLPVGYVLCAIGAQNEALSEEFEKRNAHLLTTHRAATVAVKPGLPAAPSAGGPAATVRATPAARRVAKESGVDLGEVARVMQLSGPVNEKDVRAFIEQHGTQGK